MHHLFYIYGMMKWMINPGRTPEVLSIEELGALKEIVVVGLGPGSMSDLTLGTWEILAGADKIFLRTSKHPLVQEMVAKELFFTSFDYLYEEKSTFQEVYEAIVQTLLKEVLVEQNIKRLVYAVPGNPLVGEDTVRLLLQAAIRENIKVTVKPGLSFLDAVYGLLKIDPAKGLLVLDALSIGKEDLKTSVHTILMQVYNKLVASDLKLILLESYPEDHPATIIKSAGIAKDEHMQRVPLYKLDHFDVFDHLTCVYLEPCQRKEKRVEEAYPLDPLVKIMEKLLSPGGCPWDREQDHNSLKPCLLEETYEVIEAIDSKDMNKLLEELGDLLLQVVFHATLAQKRGDFTNNDVIRVICEKLIRRHPHVFGNVIVNDSDEVIRNWEQIKSKERKNQAIGSKVPNRVMGRLNRSQSGLLLAQEVQKKAHRVGFDWKDSQGAWDKLIEEINELKNANKDKLELEAELGDVLFAVVNIARFLEVSPETAILKSINKFIHRFNYIEDYIAQNGKSWGDFNLKQLDMLWEEAKKKDFQAN